MILTWLYLSLLLMPGRIRAEHNHDGDRRVDPPPDDDNTGGEEDAELLRDHPIAGQPGSLRYLDSDSWRLSGSGGGASLIGVHVPGDVLTELQKARVIGDPWFEDTFRNASAWDRDWTYSLEFHDDYANQPGRLLVFDGLKMGAKIYLNGQLVGTATNQFVRYVFLASHLLKPTNNTLEIVFARTINTYGRYMGCSGGWDWAPMSTTTTPTFGQTGAPSPTFSMGVWKSVYLVSIPDGGAAITYVVPHVTYRGEHPILPLEDEQHDGFNVEVKVHLLSTSTSCNGTARVAAGWGEESESTVEYPFLPLSTATTGADKRLVESVVYVQLTASATQIKLWWPNGYGAQPLYTINASFVSASSSSRAHTLIVQSAQCRVGFREFAYVTTNDSDKATRTAAKLAKGSGNFTAMWRINGVPIFARGANVVPMEELEGRTSTRAIRAMMRSAAAGRMNTLRLWAGAIYYQRPFYEAADNLGLLIYHDLMFIEQGHAPCCPFYACASGWSCEGHAFNASCDCGAAPGAPSARAEIQHQLRRLGSHASIVVYDACNECGGFGNYASFVMRTVAEEDKSRAIWPSCPSNGWVQGVQRLNSRPLPSLPHPLTGAYVPTHWADIA
jgi:beta-mannosidase